MTRPRIEPVSALVALGVIAFATLIPTWGRPNTGFLCLACGQLGAPDLIVNVVLFLPIGIVLGRAGWRPLVVAGAGLAISGSVELAQVFIPGRAPTIRDILMNGIGAGVGALIVFRIGGWLAPGTRTRILLWLACLGTLLAVGLTGALIRFEPPGGVIYGQWVPDQRHLERWTGSLQAATANGISMPNSPSPLSDSLRKLLRDSVVIHLEARAGQPTGRISAIFAMMNADQEEVLLVGPRGQDLVVRVRRVAATWRLDAPEFVFPRALEGIAPGTPLTITFAGTPEGGCATVNGARHCVARLSAGGTWRLARSFGWAPPLAQHALDLLTLFVLVLPFGLLVRSAPRREAVAAALFLLVGLPLIAWWSGLAPPGAWEFGGAIMAIAAGAALHRRLRQID